MDPVKSDYETFEKTPGNFENMLKPTADLKSKHYPLK